MSTHARLGPSNHRWPHCAGSVREESGYEDIAGAAAIDGTGSHLLLELCLEHNVRAEAYDGQVIGVNHHDSPMGWMVDDSRIKRVQMCLDYVTRRVAELNVQWPGAKIVIEAESQSDPGGMFGRDDWWGTCDITITVFYNDACQFVEAIDYKDGRGWVNAKNNTQLMSYAIGKVRPYIASDPELVRPFVSTRVFGGVRMTIVQPKTNPVVRYQDAGTGELMQNAEWIAKAAHATDDNDAPVTPGKHCQWCKANPKRGGHCTAESNASLSVVKSMSNDVIATDQSLFEMINTMIGDVTQFTELQLADLADARSGIEAAFEKVNDEIQRRTDAGIQVPGYAMKPGKGSNVWNESPEDIAKMLKARRLKNGDIYPPKLISPAQMMKLENLTDDQKEKIQKKYISHKAGTMKLTKVDRDYQAPVEKDVSTMFSDVGQSETPVVQSTTSSEVNFF